MKPFYKLLLATLASVCLQINAQAFQSPTLPYDLFFVGLDSDVNSVGDDQIVLLSSRDIQQGYRFGITNALSDNRIWTSQHTTIEFANLTYTGGDVLLQGTAIKLLLENSRIEIEIGNKDVTDQFYIELSTSFSGNFINSNSFYLSVYSGIMTSSGAETVLLGTTLDVLAYGISAAKENDIILDPSVSDKEFVLPSNAGTIATTIDRENCDLCEILLLILFSENWLNLPNTYGFDLTSIPFDITDCIQTDCPDDLKIDALDCNTLFASNIPCDTITYYQWSKVVGGQLIPILTGDSGPIPNLGLTSSGLYQLHVVCKDGCRELSNRFYSDCFETPCDFDIGIQEDNCVVSVTLTGCPNPEFEWFVQTDEGTFIIAESNSSAITAEENGIYFAIITGCPDTLCIEAVSPSIEVNCGEECECELDFYEENCQLYFDTTGCSGYSAYLEYSSNNSDPWIYLGLPNSPYDPSEFGNGFYRFILPSPECSDTIGQVYIDCITPCNQVVVAPSFSDSCNLIFNWDGCFDPIFTIQYAEDCSNFANGGANLIALTTFPDGSGSAEYDPQYGLGCYQLLLNCSDECLITSDKLELTSCCESDLTIDTTGCSLLVTNIPCTGSFSYSLYADGVIIETGVNTTDFSINIDQNALYQIVIECAGCTYYSNSIDAECSTDCDVDPLLSIGECILTAIINDCENPQIQWQQFLNATWIDINGETGTSYTIIEDGTFRYNVVGCGCLEEPLESQSYTSNCFLDCSCTIDIGLDTLNCEILSSNPNCDLIESIEWFYEEAPNDWISLPQFSGQNNITPNLNGNYKKVITTKDCGQLAEEINVSCIDECLNLSLHLGEVGCTISVSWDGCFELDNWEWTYTPGTGNASNCGMGGNPEPAQYNIVSQTGNSLDGQGSMVIKPLLDGCYTFVINCNETCGDTVSVDFTACCAPEAEIVLDENPETELCDYCYYNACTDSLFEIYVIIDFQTVPLSTFDEFDFPYCDNNSPVSVCANTDCGDLPSFTTLASDINAWFATYGYEGTAQLGSGPGACKGINSPLFIEQSNIEFVNAYLWEELDWDATSNDGYQMPSFIQDNCNHNTGGGPVLKVVNACIGAEYLWSTGATTASIPFIQGQSYSVTITCPDGCTEVLTYGGIGQGSLQSNNQTNAESLNSNTTILTNVNIDLDQNTVQIYPNPSRSKVFLNLSRPVKRSLNISIYTSQGKLLSNFEFPKSKDNLYEIDVNDYQSGLYMIHVRDGVNTLKVEKLVIIK